MKEKKKYIAVKSTRSESKNLKTWWTELAWRRCLETTLPISQKTSVASDEVKTRLTKRLVERIVKSEPFLETVELWKLRGKLWSSSFGRKWIGRAKAMNGVTLPEECVAKSKSVFRIKYVTYYVVCLRSRGLSNESFKVIPATRYPSIYRITSVRLGRCTRARISRDYRYV